MTEQDLKELVAIISIKKARCEQALKNSHTAKQMKDNVLQVEFNTYVLALEGAKALLNKKNERLGSSDTAPAMIAGPQTP